MKIYFWLPIAILFGFGAAAQAQPPFMPGPMHGPYSAQPRVNPGEQAVATLREGMRELLDFLGKKEKPNKLQLAAFLDSSIAPYFDFDYMAKWAGGSLYERMDEQQRSLFAQKLKGLFFSALARNLGTYSNTAPRIDVSRPRTRGQREMDVRARVYAEHGYPVSLTFRFYRGKAGWKVFDVTANGTSAVAYYRKHFNQVARRGAIEACCR